jgi:hypothetical protein
VRTPVDLRSATEARSARPGPWAPPGSRATCRVGFWIAPASAGGVPPVATTSVRVTPSCGPAAAVSPHHPRRPLVITNPRRPCFSSVHNRSMGAARPASPLPNDGKPTPPGWASPHNESPVSGNSRMRRDAPRSSHHRPTARVPSLEEEASSMPTAGAVASRVDHACASPARCPPPRAILRCPSRPSVRPRPLGFLATRCRRSAP